MKKFFVTAAAILISLAGFAQSPPADGGQKKADAAPVKKVVVRTENKPRLGLSLMLRKSDGETPEGPSVSRVAPGSGAAEAGILKGDILLKMDGQPLLIQESSAKKDGHLCKHVNMEIPDFKEGQQVVVELKRGGEIKQVTATARKLDDERVWIQGEGGEEIGRIIEMKKLRLSDDKPRLGMALMLESEDGKSARSPVVGGVSKGSGAEEAGIQKGDVILSMDGKPLMSGEGDEVDLSIPDFTEGQKVLVRFERSGAAQEAIVTARKLEGGDLELDWIQKEGCGDFLIQEGPGKTKVRVIVETDEDSEKSQ